MYKNKHRRFRNNRTSSIYKLTALSVYVSWFILCAIAPNIGFIHLGHTQLTYGTAIIVIATYHLGFLGNIVSGFSFGMSSLIAAFIYGVAKYQLFDLSVLPRVETAIVVFLLFSVFNVNWDPKVWKLVVIAIFAAMLNSCFVFAHAYIRENITGVPLSKNGIVPIELWIPSHIVNITFEPIFGAMIIFSMYPVMIYLKNKYTYINDIYY
ncbi:hypothetical protein LAD74_01845 [Mycoplasma sp. U97]|uniref:hypothetical protein n=1 Tax=Mycoplasma tauri TaxID=547987 RepID=UPI001CBE21DA|nr:hypothetical protein [Mycoplasma tauri]MBZ4212729.1 hypothetical protein [Mycoplasma tauri]